MPKPKTFRGNYIEVPALNNTVSKWAGTPVNVARRNGHLYVFWKGKMVISLVDNFPSNQPRVRNHFRKLRGIGYALANVDKIVERNEEITEKGAEEKWNDMWKNDIEDNLDYKHRAPVSVNFL
jgi:hypothetical protein